MTASEVTDLPQPDSPTRPIVSPGATAKLTPSTARVGSSPLREKVTARSSTSSTGPVIRDSPAKFRVESFAQPLAQEREAEGDDDDAHRRPDRQRRANGQEALGRGQHRPPLGTGDVGVAEAQEAQRRRLDDRSRQ